MNTFGSFVSKETKHILRDKRTMMVLFGMPLVMMLLFGFAITTDVKNVRVVVVQQNMDKSTQRIIDKLNASEYFDITDFVPSNQEAEMKIRNQEADMALVFSRKFADGIVNGCAQIQIMIDGTDPNIASQEVNYATGVIANVHTPISTRLLYNPRMESAYNFVPGIMGLLLLIICAMMTSVSIVKEKERGTMEVLLVSPVKPLMIIIAKEVPYLVLSFVILICILLMSYYILSVPIAGSIISIFGVSLLYIMLALALGLLISVIAKTQLVALLASGMMLLIPSLMLSGMMYPIESMPNILQYVSLIVPARWYISSIRKLMIMGVGLHSVTQEISVLCAMTIILMTIALKKFKTRLE